MTLYQIMEPLERGYKRRDDHVDSDERKYDHRKCGPFRALRAISNLATGACQKEKKKVNE